MPVWGNLKNEKKLLESLEELSALREAAEHDALKPGCSVHFNMQERSIHGSEGWVREGFRIDTCRCIPSVNQNCIREVKPLIN